MGMKKNMLAPIIINRADATTTTTVPPPSDLPEWIQICPKGEFPTTICNGSNGDERMIVQVLDDEAIKSLANSMAAAGPAGILIDYDHFSHDIEHHSEAAGWIKALEARPDGLYGKAQWTDKGADAVRNRRYLFVSPTWLMDDCARLDGERVRPTRLFSAALTNSPNLNGIRAIVNNRIAGAEPAEPEGGPKMDYKAKLIALLGLPAEAKDEEINAKLEAVVREREALKEKVKALEKAQADAAKAQEEATIEKDLDANKDVIADRAAAKAALMANRSAALGMLKAMRAGGAPAAHNTAAARPPQSSPVQSADATTIINKQRAAVAEIRNRDHCQYDVAFQRAQEEHPEIFARG